MRKDIEIDYQVLAESGCGVVALDDRQRYQFEQRWREAFARRVKQKTGSWAHGTFDWHAFSHGFTRSLKGARALDAYSRTIAPEFVVTPHYPEEIAFRCQGGQLPSYSGFGVDRYAFDLECTWTMVFTHEAECGPYYCESRWLTGDQGEWS